MYSHLLSQVILILGFLGCIVAAAPDCSHPCIQCPPGHQEDWICPIGIPKPRYHSGKWPTIEEEAYAKALIGPVPKQDSCGWKADGHLCRAALNTHVTLSLVASNPLTIKVKVNNHDAYPITFWKKYSPLSEYAFEQGYFKITQGHQFAAAYAPPPEGYRPDTAPELAVINPGEALEQDIVLTDPNHVFHQMVKTGGDIEVSMSGQWNGFWATTAPEVMKSDLGFACKNIWSSLGLNWSSWNKLLLRFPKDHYVSSGPVHDNPRSEAESEASPDSGPTYPNNSSPVSSDIGDETEAASTAESSGPTTPKDEAEPEESYASEQPTTESPEYVSPENKADYSSTESPASESRASEPLLTEPSGSVSPEDLASGDPSSTSASQFDTEQFSTTTTQSTALKEEETHATAATQNWTKMASTTAQPVFVR
ncbi:hypothetical protein NW756_006397 [Fusarium oxysporum]|nr:hypothetical protein NW753_008180 [Fusarium oxysporum]KAJ4049759.1 hypothetical protein NW763_009064 [Fusarium oxysporum]KAJ4090054.1 hypothetical protein NW756_006397 [Fusarium oxysporum]KAJ4112956.1 hypothetical protein NW769_005980 [Fusarium oxysporum]KAJ4235247.1 hypothetical protein NW760_004781 [Fusarium oxysporum]